jgi:hypothetical protein
MTDELSQVELNALARRYPNLSFEDRIGRGKPVADACMFLRYQATRPVLDRVDSPPIAGIFEGHRGVCNYTHLVAHAETVGRLAEILARRGRCP